MRGVLSQKIAIKNDQNFGYKEQKPGTLNLNQIKEK